MRSGENPLISYTQHTSVLVVISTILDLIFASSFRYIRLLVVFDDIFVVDLLLNSFGRSVGSVCIFEHFSHR